MANIKRGKSKEAYGQRYKANKTQEVNRKRKLLKQQKLQPNNEQVTLALTNIGYRRQTPKVRKWSSSLRQTAQLFKLFGGRFDLEFVSPDPKVSQSALGIQSPLAAEVAKQKTKPILREKDFFSLATRSNQTRS